MYGQFQFGLYHFLDSNFTFLDLFTLEKKTKVYECHFLTMVLQFKDNHNFITLVHCNVIRKLFIIKAWLCHWLQHFFLHHKKNILVTLVSCKFHWKVSSLPTLGTVSFFGGLVSRFKGKESPTRGWKGNGIIITHQVTALFQIYIWFLFEKVMGTFFFLPV